MDNRLICKVSKGTKMDQIYLPKKRIGLSPGNYVIVSPLENPGEQQNKSFFYKIKDIEPIKLEVIEKTISLVSKHVQNRENIIITGSFLENGFNFNDIDILIITNKPPNTGELEKDLISEIGIKPHILVLKKEEFIKGLSIDPLYENMLSKFVSEKRIVLDFKREIIPEILDLNLLKSNPLIENFDILNGSERYYLTKNMMAIYLFLKNKKISKETINESIKEVIGINPRDIIDNRQIEKEKINKLKQTYKSLLDEIIDLKKNGTK